MQRIFNAPFSYVSYSEASLSLVKNWTKNPFMMLKVLSWPLIMSPSDPFVAANGVLIATFQFFLLARSGRDKESISYTFLWSILNSLVYVISGALFLGVAETN